MSTQLIQITSKCSQACHGCPFALKARKKFKKSSVIQKDMLLEELLQLRKNNLDKPMLITGGEPFEHENIWKIINKLLAIKSASSTIRFVTGGHVNLTKFLKVLKNRKYFDGISLGTDLLFSSHLEKSVFSTWMLNLNLLTRNTKTSSLTFWIDTKKVQKINKVLNQIGNAPVDFVYLRISRALKHQEVYTVINQFRSHFKYLTKDKFIIDYVSV